MAFNELLRVEDVSNLCNLFILILLVDVTNEAFSHLFDVVHRHVKVHLLLSVLYEVILR